jgi:phospholipase C
MAAARFTFALAIASATACGGRSTSPDGTNNPADTSSAGGAACASGQMRCNGVCVPLSVDDARCGAGTCVRACSGGQHCSAAGVCAASKIEHVVLIVQENHSFDSYFGRYCQAPAGSNPSCTAGRACCEGAPMVSGVYKDPSGAEALVLDDNDSNPAGNFTGNGVLAGNDRDHTQACELQEIHGGAMDRYVTGASGSDTCDLYGPSCSSPINWAMVKGDAPTDTGYPYWTLASANALADRYFQPIAGGSSSNDMYFAGAQFRFIDNQRIPSVQVGASFTVADRLCTEESAPSSCETASKAVYPLLTIADRLLDGQKTFAVYADGYARAAAAAASRTCADPAAATECPWNDCSKLSGHPIACHGCLYDPSDIPFLYYTRFGDPPGADGSFTPTPYVHDYAELKVALDGGTLPSFSFVKARLFQNEHPNMSHIADGQRFVKTTIDMIRGSSYDASTLILLTWDEGGGFFDHVAPPASPPSHVDADDTGQPVPYGTRVPMLAIGTFARTGAVSHVPMEHSSIVKFLEWNFLTTVGQLEARDGWVNNIGSVLDPAKTGITVPEK